jgi:hypothetical protein
MKNVREAGVANPTNRGQLEKTLSHLRAGGRLDDGDAALVQALRSMAGVLDGEPGNAALWRQYLRTLGEVCGKGDGGESFDDAVADLFAEVQHKAPPGA